MAGRQNLNKNALSAFEEYGVQKRKPPKVEIISSTGPAHRPCFTAAAVLGDDEICQERGSSKLEARLKAAERALQMLSLKDSSNGVSNGIDKPEEGTEDFTNPIPYKDPVSALMEYGQHIRQEVTFKLISQEGPPHMPVFTLCACIGQVKYDEVKAGSRKLAKKYAACSALNKLKQEGKLSDLFPKGASVVPISKPVVSTASAVPGRNPVSVLNEYAQKVSKRLSFESTQSGLSHKPVFKVWAVLDGEKFPEVEAPSKKHGNGLAAEKALEILASRGEYVQPRSIRGQQVPATSDEMPPLSLLAPTQSQADRIMHLVMQKMEELLLKTPESLVGRKVVSAIVMLDSQTEVLRVVSLGTGNRCVRGNNIRDSGTVLHDSHAEILARRSFKRFLYMLLLSDNYNLLVQTRSGRYGFKSNISFHLFISTAPCGDGALFTHSDQNNSNVCNGKHVPVFTNHRTQGLLRAKQENGEGTIPIEEDSSFQTYDGIQQGGRLRIMSCSDKICQWNVTGLQGALLSKFYDPVYIKSIVIGSLFNASHLSRALCCRIDYKSQVLQNQLPVGYYVNHPDIEVTTSVNTSRAVRAGSSSINWCYGDEKPEITDGPTGQTLQMVEARQGPSRLCKKNFLSLYRKLTNNQLQVHMTYKQIKVDSDYYNQAKDVFRKRMVAQGYGTWINMPREVDRFQ